VAVEVMTNPQAGVVVCQRRFVDVEVASMFEDTLLGGTEHVVGRAKCSRIRREGEVPNCTWKLRGEDMAELRWVMVAMRNLVALGIRMVVEELLVDVVSAASGEEIAAYKDCCVVAWVLE
jgi:7-cyano-7-deazaguanine synthase in queuosine biosynthesis